MTKVWASLDDFTRPEGGAELVGRRVAADNFLKALWKYGGFDEYHFFLANQAHRNLFQNHHGAFLEKIGLTDRVRLFDRLDLPRMMRDTDYTVFHLSDHITWFNPLCRLRNRIAPIPITAAINSLSYSRFMGAYLDMAHGGPTASDAFFCLSEAGKMVIQKSFQRIHQGFELEPPDLRLEVITPGIDGDLIPRGNRGLARKELGFKDDEVIGLCFGRLSDHDKMDHFPLLQAFARILKEDSPRRLVLAGSCDEGEDYEKMLRLWARALGIKGKLSIFKNPDEKTKWRLYDAADFFISIADNPQETFGITLIEAMACGLPLLVSDYDGYKETATEDVAFRVATTWDCFEELTMLEPLMDERTLHRYFAQCLSVDLRELAGYMERLYEDHDTREKMGRAARRRFEKTYDYRVLIPRIERLWTELKERCRINPEASKKDPLIMDVFQVFSHYPTKTLDPNELLVRSPFAESLRRMGADYPLLPGMSEIIDEKVVKKLLFKLRKSMTVEEIVKTTGDPAWKTRYTLLWMLKHELLMVDDP